ncbi:kinase-like protein [Schizophyllum commune Loenen D]|nr:kinase-like protein [Schizophyllum commune Loenen D]
MHRHPRQATSTPDAGGHGRSRRGDHRRRDLTASAAAAAELTLIPIPPSPTTASEASTPSNGTAAVPTDIDTTIAQRRVAFIEDQSASGMTPEARFLELSDGETQRRVEESAYESTRPEDRFEDLQQSYEHLISMVAADSATISALIPHVDEPRLRETLQGLNILSLDRVQREGRRPSSRSRNQQEQPNSVRTAPTRTNDLNLPAPSALSTRSPSIPSSTSNSRSATSHADPRRSPSSPPTSILLRLGHNLEYGNSRPEQYGIQYEASDDLPRTFTALRHTSRDQYVCRSRYGIGAGSTPSTLQSDAGSIVVVKGLSWRRNATSWGDFSSDEHRLLGSLMVQSYVPTLENIHCLRDVFCDEEDSGWLVTVYDYMPVTLRHLLRDGPLPQSLTASVFLQISVALEHLHQHHIIHCNVSPDDILLAFDAHAGRLDVKLGGLCHVMRSRMSLSERRTAVCAGNPLLPVINGTAPGVEELSEWTTRRGRVGGAVIPPLFSRSSLSTHGIGRHPRRTADIPQGGYYDAPEWHWSVLEEPSEKADYWSLGAVAAEMVLGVPLFPAHMNTLPPMLPASTDSGAPPRHPLLAIAAVLGSPDPQREYVVDDHGGIIGGGSWTHGMECARSVGLEFDSPSQPVNLLACLLHRAPVHLAQAIIDLLWYNPSRRGLHLAELALYLRPLAACAPDVLARRHPSLASKMDIEANAAGRPQAPSSFLQPRAPHEASHHHATSRRHGGSRSSGSRASSTQSASADSAAADPATSGASSAALDRLAELLGLKETVRAPARRSPPSSAVHRSTAPSASIRPSVMPDEEISRRLQRGNVPSLLSDLSFLSPATTPDMALPVTWDNRELSPNSTPRRRIREWFQDVVPGYPGTPASSISSWRDGSLYTPSASVATPIP